MARSRNRSGVPSEAALAALSDAELEAEAQRIRLRLGTPLSPIVLKGMMKKKHAVEAEFARRAG